MAKRKRIKVVLRHPRRIIVSVERDAAMDAILREARIHDWNLLDPSVTGGAIVQDIAPSGAILQEVPSQPIVRALLKQGVPVVRIGNLPHPGDRSVAVVLPDQYAAGRMAADHLYGRGFRHLAHIGSDPWSLARPLHEGFVARAQELGLPLPSLLRLKSGGEAHTLPKKLSRYKLRAQVVVDWLRSLEKPVGILVYGDLRAASLSVMCYDAGIKVPDEVGLLGYGNNERICESSPVAISSIDAAYDEIGREAAVLLRGLMNGAPLPTEPLYVAPHGVVERRSTDVFAVADPLVARAIRLIWDHYNQDFTVMDISMHVGVPRYQLERLFRKHCDCGINEMLVRRRLDQFVVLLRTTRDPITDLSLECGFRTMANLHKAFNARYGISPRSYRKKHGS